MRTLALPVLTIIVTVLCASCEQRESEKPPAVVTTAPSGTTLPDRAQQLAAVTRPTSTSPTSDRTAPTSRQADSASTPAAAVTQLLDLMVKQDIQGIRTMMAEPVSGDALRPDVEQVASNVAAGAKWEVVDTIVAGVAAVVIVRTNVPGLKPEFTPLVLVNRYDRWKVILPGQQPSHRRFTEGEKNDMSKAMEPTAKRLAALRGMRVPSTSAAAAATTTTTTTTTAPAAAAAKPL